MSGGAVGGFTSWLKLESAEGFDDGVKEVNKLTEALKNLKKEAGTLGNMKLKITIDDGSMDQYKRTQQELRNKEKTLRQSGGNVAKFDRTKMPTVAGNIKDHDKEQKEKDKRNQVLKKYITKEVTDTLSFFATSLKWTAGIVLGFGGALATLAVKNSQENTNLRSSASSFAMSSIDLYKLNKAGGIFGGGDSAFNNLLANAKKMVTEPYLSGDINSPMLIAMKQALPKLDIASLVKKNPQDYMETIFNEALAGLKEAKGLQGNSNVNVQNLGKQQQLRISEVMGSLGGEDFWKVLVGSLNSKLGNVNNLNDLLKIQGQGALVNGRDIEKSAEFNQNFNKLLADLMEHLNKFINTLQGIFNPILVKLDGWLIKNKDQIANLFVDIANVIGGLFGENKVQAKKSTNNLLYGRELAEGYRKYGILDKNDDITGGTSSFQKTFQERLKDFESTVEWLKKDKNRFMSDKEIQVAIDSSGGDIYKLQEIVGDKAKTDPRFKKLLDEMWKDNPSGLTATSYERKLKESGGLDAYNKKERENFNNNIPGTRFYENLIDPKNQERFGLEKVHISYNGGQSGPTDVTLNATFNIDPSQNRIYQTIRSQNVNNMSKLATYNGVGQSRRA